ncbi:MAG: STAS domain-containing protein [Ignavibacteriae bacterium]|nr:anti-sigma factor antagonist [Ignavibacteriota bacterium]NOG98420.1 STAS domain-containing protein [Ignavibacteriota bacterium]
MKVLMTETANGAVLKLEGKMMLGYEANDFHEAVLTAIENNKKNIVVDLSDVKFISSWGIGILVYGYTTATNGGGTFKLAAMPQDIKNILVKVKLDKIFEQFETVEEALMI